MFLCFSFFLISAGDLRVVGSLQQQLFSVHYHWTFPLHFFFFTTFYSVFTSRIAHSPSVFNYSFSQCAWLRDSLWAVRRQKKLYLARSEWKCHKVCKRKSQSVIAQWIHLIFQAFAQPVPQWGFMCEYVCTSVTPFSLVCLFVPKSVKGGMSAWIEDKCLTFFLTDLVFLHLIFIVLVPLSFSSSQSCWSFLLQSF